MADFRTPFGLNSGRRLPTADERSNGFPCGPADQTLFNGLFNRIEAELGDLIAYAGLTGTDTNFTQVRQAVLALITAATGGGETSDYLLMSQAVARLPIYPEIQSADGKINVSSPAAGTVRLPGGVSFVHRGVSVLTTAETDFPTAIGRTYHLRWSPANGFQLKDLLDSGYNPTILAETDPAFDSKLDDMLIARVVTNSSNVPTITNLMNRNTLAIQQLVQGTNPQDVGANGARWDFTVDYNWARTPTNFDFTLARGWASSTPADDDFNIRPLGATFDDVNNSNPQYVVSRYRVAQTIMRDHATTLWMNYNARA